jgi:hypothetical protein
MGKIFLFTGKICKYSIISKEKQVTTSRIDANTCNSIRTLIFGESEYPENKNQKKKKKRKNSVVEIAFDRADEQLRSKK